MRRKIENLFIWNIHKILNLLCITNAIPTLTMQSELFEKNSDKLFFQKSIIYRGMQDYDTNALVKFFEETNSSSLDDFNNYVKIISDHYLKVVDIGNIDAPESVKNFCRAMSTYSNEYIEKNVRILEKICDVIEWLKEIKSFDVSALKSLKDQPMLREETINRLLNDKTKQDYIYIPNGFFHCMSPKEFREPLIALTRNGYSQTYENEIGWKLSYDSKNERWTIIDL